MLFAASRTDTLGRMRLLKLLYLASRRSIKETAAPIVDDAVVAMRTGPILSHTYDCIKVVEREEPARDAWLAHFRVLDPVRVRTAADPGTDHLLDYDVETLDAIAQKIRDRTDAGLSRLTHEFAEYKRNRRAGNGPASPIPEADILAGLGYDLDAIRVILADAQRSEEDVAVLGGRRGRRGRGLSAPAGRMQLTRSGCQVR